MWACKHRPSSLDSFIGRAAVEDIRKWDGRPLIIHGGSGTGKTLLSHLIAKERGWDVVIVSGENLESAIHLASTGTIFGNKRMLLVEDVESLKDVKAIAKLVDETKNPMILTSSDYSNKRLATIKKKCSELQLRRPLPASIAKYLALVLEAEGITSEKSALELIARNSGGDIRAAINDLESVASGREHLCESDLVSLLPERDRETDIYKALSIIFGGRNMRQVVESTWDLSEQPRDIIWWVEENTPRLYVDKSSIRDAYSNLSRADVFLGRIMRRQHWGFLKYANVLMTAGVNSSRPAKINFTQYQFPGFFAAMGRFKGTRNLESSISQKMGPRLHASSRIFRKEYIPLYRLLLSKAKVNSDELSQEFKLEDEEVEYLEAR